MQEKSHPISAIFIFKQIFFFEVFQEFQFSSKQQNIVKTFQISDLDNQNSWFLHFNYILLFQTLATLISSKT